MTKEEYFETSEKDGMPVLSNSLIKHAVPRMGGSATKFYHHWREAADEESTPAQTLGTWFHQWQDQGEDSFYVQRAPKAPSDTIQYIMKDAQNHLIHTGGEISDLPGDHAVQFSEILDDLSWYSNQSMNARLNKIYEHHMYWKDLKLGRGKTIIDLSTFDQIKGMSESMENVVLHNKTIPSGYGGLSHLERFTELAIEFKYEEFDAKALIDLLIIDHKTKVCYVFDYKTTGKPVEHFLGKYYWDHSGNLAFQPGDYQNYNYHLQAYWYTIAAKEYLAQRFPGIDLDKDWAVTFDFIAVESKAPYDCQVFTDPYRRLAVHSLEDDNTLTTIVNFGKVTPAEVDLRNGLSNIRKALKDNKVSTF